MSALCVLSLTAFLPICLYSSIHVCLCWHKTGGFWIGYSILITQRASSFPQFPPASCTLEWVPPKRNSEIMNLSASVGHLAHLPLLPCREREKERGPLTLSWVLNFHGWLAVRASFNLVARICCSESPGSTEGWNYPWRIISWHLF